MDISPFWTTGKKSDLLTTITDAIVGLQVVECSTSDSQIAAQGELLAIVTTATNILIYTLEDKKCVRSWRLISDGEDTVITHKAVLVPGTNFLFCLTNDGTTLVKINNAISSKTLDIQQTNPIELEERCSHLLTQTTLESVLVLAFANSGVSLLDAHESQNISTILQPEDNGTDNKTDVTLKHAVLLPGYASNKRRSVDRWKVMILQKNNDAKFYVRFVGVKVESNLLALGPVSEHELVVPYPLVDVSKLCYFTSQDAAVLTTTGETHRLHFPLDANTLEVTSSYQDQHNTVSASVALGALSNGSPYSLCLTKWSSGDNVTQLDVFDCKHGVISQQYKPKTTAQHKIELLESCANSSSGFCVVSIDKIGAIRVYSIKKNKCTLASVVGSMVAQEDTTHSNSKQNDAVEVEIGIDLLCSKNRKNWEKVISKKRKEDTAMYNKFQKCKTAKQFTTLTQQLIDEAMPLPLALVQRVVSCCIVDEKAGHLEALEKLISTRTVSLAANPNLVTHLIKHNKVELLYDCLSYVQDISESQLVEMLVYVLGYAAQKHLETFAQRWENNFKTGRKRKRENESQEKKAEKILGSKEIQSLPKEQRGVMYFVLGVLCVPFNERFVVSSLRQVDESIIYVLFTIIAHLLALFGDAPDCFVGTPEVQQHQSSKKSKKVTQQDKEITRQDKKVTSEEDSLRIPSISALLSWQVMLLDSNFRTLVNSATQKESFVTLLKQTQKLCGDNVQFCSAAQNVQLPLNECLQRSRWNFTSAIRAKPSAYCIEMIRI